MHCDNHPGQLQGRIELPSDGRQGVEELDQPLERQVLGLVTVNALVASDRVIVPVQAEYLALEGLIEFLDTLTTVRRELNPSLELA
ncbi:MAG: AAA family ATPase, partial [Solirubrobacterales bacterium]